MQNNFLEFPATDTDQHIIITLDQLVKSEREFPSTSTSVQARIFQPTVDALRSTLSNNNFMLARRLQALTQTALKIAEEQLSINPKSDLSMEFTRAVSRFVYPTTLNDAERTALASASKAEAERQKKLQVKDRGGWAVNTPPERLLSEVLWKVHQINTSHPQSSQIK